MSDFPVSVPAFPVIVDDVNDVLGQDQNTPNDEITALASALGAFGKSQSYSIDFLQALMALIPTISLSYVDVDTIQASAGVTPAQNAAGSQRVLRRNTSTVNITFANIDTGARAVSTQYYVWAIADAAGTTVTFKVSTSASAPTGSTIYFLIGKFQTNSTGSGQVISDSVLSAATFYYNLLKQTPAAAAVCDTSGSATLNASFNISSITRNGTGDIKFTFRNALPNATYAAITTGDDGGPHMALVSTKNTTDVRIKLFTSTTNVAVDGIINLIVFPIG